MEACICFQDRARSKTGKGGQFLKELLGKTTSMTLKNREYSEKKDFKTLKFSLTG